MNRKGFYGLIVVLFVGIALGASASDLPPIRVGVASPFTGLNALYGELMWRGVTLKAEEINAEGGIDGRMIELVRGDTVGDPREGVAVAHMFVDDRSIPVIVGYTFSGVMLSAQPVLRAGGLPNISPHNTHVDVGRMSDWTFRVVFRDDFQAQFLARYAAEVYDVERAAILYELADYQIGLMHAFVAAAPDFGIEVVAAEAYATGATDFLPQLTKLRGLNPDAIFLASYFSEAGMAVGQAYDVLGWEPFFFGPDGIMMPEFIELAGPDAAEGTVGSTPFIADRTIATEETLRFIDAFEDKFDAEPGWFSAKAYDALGFAARAIAAVGPEVDYNAVEMRPLIKEYFASITTAEDAYTGVTGVLFFDEVGDSAGPAIVARVEDGAFRMHPVQLLD